MSIQRKNKIFRLILNKALFLAFLLPAPVSFSQETKGSFSIIVLPDTQNYVKYPGAEKKFASQTKWISDNKDTLNIEFVVHEGDITDNNSEEQWEKAKECMKTLDGIVPYAICVGNHDIGHSAPKGVSLIEEYFPESSFEGSPCWGGKMPGQNCFWHKFKAGKNKFLVVSLDLGASDKMLEWADGILAANKDRKAILVTHELLDQDGKLSNKDTKKNATAYGQHLDGSPRNTGEEIWKKHIAKHKNYILALCGHYNGIASRTEMKGDNGNTVHIVMANYQYSEGGGNGFLRIMKFDQDAVQCDVSTYSPFLDKFWKDEKNDFIVKWGKP